MTKRILFVHGAGEGAYDEDRLLVDSLERSLRRGYRVDYPRMPEDAPDYLPWQAALQQAIAGAPGQVIVVGHSLGGSVLLKVLAETVTPNPIEGIFLIAAPCWGADENWRDETLTLPDDFASKLPPAPVFLYQARDDEITPFEHLAAYRAKLPKAVVRELPDGGHQLGNDLSAIAADIKTL